MKIAIDARTLGSKPSGIGMYLFDFLKELVKYKEFDIYLITDVKKSEYIKSCSKMGLKVISYGKPVRMQDVFSYFGFIQKQLDIIKPDVFWEINNLIPKKLKGDFKTVVTIHDMFPITHAKDVGRIYGIYFKHFMKSTIANADYILYNSRETKKQTYRFYPEAKTKKSMVSYIILDRMKDVPETRDDGYFLYVGNMEKRKGVETLLAAYALYKKRGGEKNLVLAGKQNDNYIRQQINRAMLLTKDIEYMNYVSQKKKNELYAHCSCFIFPSKAEGFGMPVVEVMQFNKPIIVGNLTIYDEIVGDCVNRFKMSDNFDVEALANAMENYDSNVDTAAYNRVLDSYAPEVLGEKLKKFFLSIR